MYYQAQCSRCGHRSRRWRYTSGINDAPSLAPDALVQAGWGSFGRAMYCPHCAATWTERNGTDRPLWGNGHTRELALLEMAYQLERELDRLTQPGNEYDY